MTAIWFALMSAVKNILVKCISQKFFEWALFWDAEMLVKHTDNKHDDKLLVKVKELYEQGK